MIWYSVLLNHILSFVAKFSDKKIERQNNGRQNNPPTTNIHLTIILIPCDYLYFVRLEKSA